MKEYDVTSTFHGIEKELDKYKMSTKNYGGLGAEILENDTMEITASNAIPEMDIANLTNEQVAQIKEQENRRPTESAIIRRRERAMAKVATQREEDQQYK